MNEELLEKLAALEHEQWSHWMNYMFGERAQKVEIVGEDERLFAFYFTEDDILKWSILSDRKYEELHEREKASDRRWALKVLKIVGEKDG